MPRAAPTRGRLRASPVASRRHVVRAGLTLLDRDGYEAFSLRRLAGIVGTTPMALYHYFPSKEALLDAVLGLALSELRMPRERGGRWRTRIRRLTLSFRRLLRRHPHVVPLLMSRPALGAPALRWYDATLGVLRSSGLSDEDVVRGYAALYGYTLGFAAVERVRSGTPFAATARASSSVLAHTDALPAEAIATLAALAPKVGRFNQRQFEFGLDLLLSGLEARAAQLAMAPPNRKGPR